MIVIHLSVSVKTEHQSFQFLKIKFGIRQQNIVELEYNEPSLFTLCMKFPPKNVAGNISDSKLRILLFLYDLNRSLIFSVSLKPIRFLQLKRPLKKKTQQRKRRKRQKRKR